MTLLSLSNLVSAARIARELEPVNKAMTEVVKGLSNPANVATWREGIETPDYTSDSVAYSNFAGFRSNMVLLVAEAAADITMDGPARFAANDVEHVLDPSRVSTFIQSVSENATPAQLRNAAERYFGEGMAKAMEARQSLGQPAIPTRSVRTP